MDDLIAYFFAPSHGYSDALWVRHRNGSIEVWSTGPYLDESLARLVAAGVPHETISPAHTALLRLKRKKS